MAVTKGEWLRIAFTAVLAWLLQRLWNRLLTRRKQIVDKQQWDDRVDIDNIQACLLSSVNLGKCGRIEKRTIMTKKLSDIFSNEYVRDLVLEAAAKTTNENPFVASFLRREDRWNVLVAAQNHLSSVFGPYHLFSNQVSSYESVWYVFTLVGVRTDASGRFFITPQHPVKEQNDRGVLRIRLVMIEEQELRKICCGDISDSDGVFSERHGARWKIMQRLGDMFEKQIFRVTQQNPQNANSSFDVRTRSWGFNLCGTAKKIKAYSDDNVEVKDLPATEEDEELPSELDCFLRIHVPVPLLKETNTVGPQEVVLYE